MCKAMEDMREEALKAGMEKGLEKGMIDTARRMLQLGKYAVEEIASISGLPLEEVLKLKTHN